MPPTPNTMTPAIYSYWKQRGPVASKFLARHWKRLHFITTADGSVVEVRPRDNRIQYYVAFDLAKDVDDAVVHCRRTHDALARDDGKAQENLERQDDEALRLLAERRARFTSNAFPMPRQPATPSQRATPYARKSPRVGNKFPSANPKLPQTYLPSTQLSLREQSKAHASDDAAPPDNASSQPSRLAIQAKEAHLGHHASNYLSAHHEELRFKLCSDGAVEEVLPKRDYETTHLAYQCARHVDDLQKKSFAARRELEAIAASAKGSSEHFTALEDFFLASPTPALDSFAAICLAAERDHASL
ncbi:hypothetical protein C8F01DRAFT_1253134 [Mycena amicta]|nr:hypothetical protein C8F01DRAFT_1253134 [Mycena amicta]